MVNRRATNQSERARSRYTVSEVPHYGRHALEDLRRLERRLVRQMGSPVKRPKRSQGSRIVYLASNPM